MYKIHIFESVPPTINQAWKSKYSFERNSVYDLIHDFLHDCTT